jgi:hypothetical protein
MMVGYGGSVCSPTVGYGELLLRAMVAARDVMGMCVCKNVKQRERKKTREDMRQEDKRQCAMM